MRRSEAIILVVIGGLIVAIGMDFAQNVESYDACAKSTCASGEPLWVNSEDCICVEHAKP